MGNPNNTRFLLTTFGLFLFLLQTNGQNIGIGTTTPDPTAKVEIVATDKGILIPRLTTVQRTGIVSPAVGLLVFDTNLQGFWYWNGTSWNSLPTANQTWSTAGNSGTNPSTHFVGTIDNKPLLLRTNNQRVGYIGIPGSDGNIFLGRQSGASTTTGFSNIAIGQAALASNTTNNNLIAFGDSALYSNTTGLENTAVGSKALYLNIGGIDNTAVGFHSLTSNTGGAWNTASGAHALASNISGHNNTASGYAAMNSSLTGSNNTANGHGAMGSSLTGSNNTAIGFSALAGNEDGNSNTAIGYQSLENNNHGVGNTAVGERALRRNQDGNDNSAFGRSADMGTTDLTNAAAIGSRARVDCSNCMVLGSISGVNGALADVNVGIGTTNPTSKLEVSGKTQTDQLQVGTGTVLSNIQSGTFTVGPSAIGLLTITLNFPTAFVSPPKVIATVRGSNFNDTFAVSTRSISTTQVVFNIQRVDINGSWAQNLQLDWIAIQ